MTDTPDPGGTSGDSAAAADEPRGVDIARRALEEARAAAKASGKSVGQGRSSVRALRPRRSRRTWSGSGPDDRDPQTLGSLTSALAQTRGWSSKVSEGTVFGLWPKVVGEDIASHAEPTALRDGVLSISAESTAWATQLRMMQSQIIAKIAAAVGSGVVTSVRITGPSAPSWRKGDRHVSGRGPRDTYG
jgi:predicted nucleic acid-binding Zn ribbon protein